jgi:DNA-binding response OmpR family regulator
MPGPSVILAGKCILVVEDEYLVAMETEWILQEAGATVVGPCAGLKDAKSALASGQVIDAAVLDVNLGDGTRIDDVAIALRQRGVPILFQTGYGAEALPTSFAETPLLTKPVRASELTNTLVAILGHQAS